jgi:hypothetical protein
MKISYSVFASAAALVLMTGINTSAFAEAKDAASKVTEIKQTETMEKAPSDSSFKRLDANGDGKISLKESTKDKTLFKNFDASDANKDGMITTDEYAKYAQINAETVVN